MAKSKLKLKQKEKQIQEQEKGETFEDVIKELQDALSTTAEEYIPRACTALKRHNPLISSAAIRSTVLSNPVISRVWTESTIRKYWPNWMKNPNIVEAVTKDWQENPKRQIASKIDAISQDDLDKEEEDTPVSSQPIWEYEETHPKVAESPFEALGEINRSIARLLQALTGKKNMPTMEDNVKKDYVISTRDRFKDIVNGSSKVERDFLFNWLVWLNQVIVDRIDIVEKSDKTAYDTRKGDDE